MILLWLMELQVLCILFMNINKNGLCLSLITGDNLITCYYFVIVSYGNFVSYGKLVIF